MNGTVYIVPGAAHCAINSLQPNAAFLNTNFAQMIEWVENDVVSTTLNATVPTGGVDAGSVTRICTWPSRPYWTDNSTTVCQSNQTSIETMQYDLDAYVLPVH